MKSPDDAAPLVPMLDLFVDDRRAGRVIGTRNAAGGVRRGRDAEGQIAIDNGALRLQPLLKPGWGRQGVVYGPYRRTPGLTLTVVITNGHNTSQSGPLPETFGHRVRRWILGSESDPRLKRIVAWLRSRARGGTLRRLRWWLSDAPELNENLAVGWFPTEAPDNPLEGGAAFVVHAAEGENGELWARVQGQGMPAFRGLQNLQIHYVIILRARGAAYYASSGLDAFGLAPFPYMRPIAIEPFDDHQSLFAGLYQSVLGQIGFRVDTRVHEVSVAQFDEYRSWCGSAHAADELIGGCDLDTRPAERGGEWRVLAGRWVRTRGGARATEAGAMAVLDPGEPSGLLHLLVETGGAKEGAIGIVWRLRDLQNHWMLLISHEGCELILVRNGTRSAMARDVARSLPQQGLCSVQILDGYGHFGLYLDGVRLFDAWFSDTRLRDATAVGLYAEQADGPVLRAFEAHPTGVSIPQRSIRVAPCWSAGCERLVVADSFAGEASDLHGRPAEHGGVSWRRILGQGAIDLTGDAAARVRATVEEPNPGRLAYVVPWNDHRAADVEVTVVPPGSGRWHRQNCRSGLIFWHDEKNYLTFTSYLSDEYEGASIAMFSYLNGYEELYDAIWTMVSSKIDWGKPFRLRIVFDEMQFMVWIDGEAILQRALTDLYPNQLPLRITMVGLAVNWEWGNDTGSLFKNFVARA